MKKTGGADAGVGLTKYAVAKLLTKWKKSDAEKLARIVLADGIEEVLDIPYKGGGASGHLLDVYRPVGQTEKLLPVIINFHGGGFIHGAKEQTRPYGFALSKRGFVVVNANYRLALRDTDILGQIRDVTDAVVWAKQHAAEYGGNSETLFIAGQSAGGMLAALSAAASNSPRLAALFGTEPYAYKASALGIDCGMLDIKRPTLGYRALRSMCLERGYKKKEYYKNLSFDGLAEIRGFPPSFLSTGDEDGLRTMTLRFLETLSNNDVEFRLKYFQKQKGKTLGHIFSVYAPDSADGAELLDEMTEFFLLHTGSVRQAPTDSIVGDGY